MEEVALSRSMPQCPPLAALSLSLSRRSSSVCLFVAASICCCFRLLLPSLCSSRLSCVSVCLSVCLFVFVSVLSSRVGVTRVTSYESPLAARRRLCCCCCCCCLLGVSCSSGEWGSESPGIRPTTNNRVQQTTYHGTQTRDHGNNRH